MPGAITGVFTVCSGSTTLFSDPTYGGAWATSDPSVATVTAAGHVTGLTAGTATISYTKANICGTASAIQEVTINPLPVAGSVTATATEICPGTTSSFSDPATGGVWSSSNPAVASVGSTGIVTGALAGVANIHYTVANGCATASANLFVTVNTTPAIPTSISGTARVCPSTGTLFSNATPGGVWSSSDPAIGTVNTTGIVTGIGSGEAIISYTKTNLCGSTSVLKTLTVDPLPVADPITGDAFVCAGSVTILHDLSTGGIWTSDNNTVAVIGSTGVVSAMSPGVATISFVAENACGSSSAATITVTVNQLPSAGTISASPNKVCVGKTIELSNIISGGTWSSSNSDIATVSDLGVVTGVFTGTDDIIYTFTNSCGTVTTSAEITVVLQGECDLNTKPVAGATLTELKAYPNPNNGSFNVLLSSATDEQAHVIVTNVVGQKVNEFNVVTNKPSDVRLDQAAGTYFVTAITNNGKYVIKVTVE